MASKENIFLGILICIILFPGCEKSVEPFVYKDPRLFTWTIDTLAYPGSYQTSLSSIWGSSPKDVYAVGWNDQVTANMYNFRKGIRWMEVNLAYTDGGPFIGAYGFGDIFGFAWNDIWAVGSRSHTNPKPPPNSFHSSFLIHFNGTKWEEVILNNGIIDNSGLSTIWGSSPNNIYTCGYNSYLWHYDGINWKKDSIPVHPQLNCTLALNSITGDNNGNVYLYVYSSNKNGNEIHYFLTYKNNKWSIRDSAFIDLERMEEKWGYEHLWMSPEGNLYSAGLGIFIWRNEKWDKILDIPNNRFIRIFGTSERNYFAVGTRGKVYHYNGNDWYQFKQFINEDIMYSGIWMDGNETFIVGHILSFPQKTIILHGK